MYILTYRYRYL